MATASNNTGGSTNAVVAQYVGAFAGKRAADPFLTYYAIGVDKALQPRSFTRGQFWALALRAADVLRGHELGKGSAVCFVFSENTVEDLAFRLACVLLGCIPVTVNWSADSDERVRYKHTLTNAQLIIGDKCKLDEMMHVFNGKPVFEAKQICSREEEEDISADEFVSDLCMEDPRIIIFTSGTTANPKGVVLPYSSYETNRRTFEDFLELNDAAVMFHPVIVNPMHHTNSTAFTDMALRRPGTHLHLFPRYTTAYWKVLVDLVRDFKGKGKEDARIVCPTVSRHFDFLEGLVENQSLPGGLSSEDLVTALLDVDFLIGSAPVGPTTVERLQRYAGKLPLVRFGSTETCLQVVGTPRNQPLAERLESFKAGWNHTWNGEQQVGYWIGCQHPGHTEVQIVKGVDRSDASTFMVACAEGEPGKIVTRGQHVMKEYVSNPEATEAALHYPKNGKQGQLPWYLKFGDVGFYLSGSGQRNIYWQSRDSAMLIRGGANYAYEQINAELLSFIAKNYCSEESTYAGMASAMYVAVVGMNLESEHEDSCLVTVELKREELQGEDAVKAEALEALLDDKFLVDAQTKGAVTKGARPDRLRFGDIPRTFKGSILVRELKKQWTAELED